MLRPLFRNEHKTATRLPVILLPEGVWTCMFCVGHAGLQTIRLLSRACSPCLKRPSFNLLDSLLQEVCIESDADGSLTVSLSRFECLSSQSKPSFFEANESLLMCEFLIVLTI